MDMVEGERFNRSRWGRYNIYWYAKDHASANKRTMPLWARNAKGHIPWVVIWFVKRFFKNPPDAISDFWHCQKLWMIVFSTAAVVPPFVASGYWWLGLIVFSVSGVLGNIVFSKTYK